MSFTKTNVMMVDSTIITGVLILLTITIIGEKEALSASFFQFIFKSLVVFSLAPFAISALLEVTDMKYYQKHKKSIPDEPTKMSLRFMQIGFVYLLMLIGFVMYLEFNKVLVQNMSESTMDIINSSNTP